VKFKKEHFIGREMKLDLSIFWLGSFLEEILGGFYWEIEAVLLAEANFIANETHSQ